LPNGARAPAKHGPWTDPHLSQLLETGRRAVGPTTRPSRTSTAATADLLPRWAHRRRPPWPPRLARWGASAGATAFGVVPAQGASRAVSRPIHGILRVGAAYVPVESERRRRGAGRASSPTAGVKGRRSSPPRRRRPLRREWTGPGPLPPADRRGRPGDGAPTDERRPHPDPARRRLGTRCWPTARPAPLLPESSPDDLAYLLYTSGLDRPAPRG